MNLILIRKTLNGYVIEEADKGEYVACNQEILFSLLKELIEAPTPPPEAVEEPPHKAVKPPPPVNNEEREDL